MDKKIASLITKYIKRTISEKEFNVLKEWVMKSDYNKEDFKDTLVKYKRSVISNYTIRDIQKQSRHKILFVRSAVAAVLVGLISAALFLFDDKNVPIESPKKEVVVMSVEKKGVVVTTSGNELELVEIIDNELLEGVKATNNALDYSAIKEDAVAVAEQTTVYVPKGERFEITLSDGTKLWINSDTKVEYPSIFTDSCRRIKVSGEVFLNVAHNRAKPFIVEALGAEITVLGTKFNVAAYPMNETIETTLLEGSVSFVRDEIKAILAINEQITINKNTSEYIIRDVEAERFCDWTEGAYHFNEIALRDLAELFNRVYGVEVIIHNAASMHKRFTGTILKSIAYDEMFHLFMKTTDIKYEIKNECIEIW